MAFKGLDDTAYSGAYHYARSGDLVQGFSSCTDLVQGFSSCTDLVHGFSSCTDLVQGFSSCANLVQGFSSCADLEQGFSSCTSHFPPPPPHPHPPQLEGKKCFEIDSPFFKFQFQLLVLLMVYYTVLC